MTREGELARALAAAGLPLIAVPDAGPGSGVDLPAGRLVAELIRSHDAMFIVASVPLLLFDARAEDPAAEATLAGDDRRVFAHLHCAAAAMRSRWRSRLTQAGALHEIPDRHAVALGLPSPAERFGDPCLLEIADRFEDGRAGARIRGFGSMLDRLIEHALASRERTVIVATAG